jgi:hypothetical protein
MVSKYATCAALTICVCLPGAALARDSSRYVCSAVVEYQIERSPSQIGMSIDFLDTRAENGDSRKYQLSSIYQGKLFQGVMIDRSENYGQGTITLKSGESQLYVGRFKLEQRPDDSYVMVLDGKINDDPAAGKTLYPIKARLPCVDLSV